jgi:hypothetical protein
MEIIQSHLLFLLVIAHSDGKKKIRWVCFASEVEKGALSDLVCSPLKQASLVDDQVVSYRVDDESCHV